LHKGAKRSKVEAHCSGGRVHRRGRTKMKRREKGGLKGGNSNWGGTKSAAEATGKVRVKK